ncbi:PA3496 family putative envelope integrity protein [Legionella sp. WA2022007384]
MDLHEDYDDQSFSDYNYDDDIESTAHRKNIRRMLEEKLERKRLKEEFKDDFDELSGDFDWDILDK